MTDLEKVEQLSPELVNTFISTGKCSGIPEDVQLFLRQLQWAAEIYDHERNISRAARTLRNRIASSQHLSLDVRTCQARIYAAINYFSMDNNVSMQVWETDYANKFEDLAKYAIQLNDIKSASKCYERAHECRKRAAQIAESARDMGIVFLIDPKIRPEDMGFESKSLKEIAAKSNEGFYVRLINDLKIDSAEKKRLLRDADIQEAEYTEVSEDEV